MIALLAGFIAAALAIAAIKAKWIATKARLGWEYLPDGK